MQLSNEFFLRLLGALIAAMFFGFLGERLADTLAVSSPLFYIVLSALVGVLLGLLLTPYVTTRPLRSLRSNLLSMSPERLVAIVVGTFMGLVATALLTPMLSLLPTPFREIMPVAAAVVFCYSAVVILTLRQSDIQSWLGSVNLFSPAGDRQRGDEGDKRYILLDTSVIIDGRIVDVSKTGFLRGTLLVPRFILSELQHIADSSDVLRRNRGRRGLDILNILQKDSPVPVRITDMDVTAVREVDGKLVALARDLRCPILTNDYNLNRVAELQGVTVLNINDLANAIKTIYLPGESLSVRVIQEGKEQDQGVGFLDDGTMVVVENGIDALQSTINVTVTKVLQTSAGRMIFARPSFRD